MIEKLEKTPQSIRLAGYRPVYDFDPQEIDLEEIGSIAEDTKPINLGRITMHDFEIIIDGRSCRVVVSGVDAKFAKMDEPASD